MKWLARLTLNQRLALAAFLLGVGAAFAHPAAGATVRINPQELAVQVQRGADRVAPLQLASWLIEGRSDYRLIDVREQTEYDRYHIPTAENIPLTSLPSADIAPTEKVLLYSDDGARSAQAWFLLRAKHVRGAYILDGGVEGWKASVLFPAIADGADPRSSARLQAISRHFGGSPRGAAAEPVVSESANLPPPAPAASASARPKPKKKEGC